MSDDATPLALPSEQNPTRLRDAPIHLRRMLDAIPPSDKEILSDPDHGIAAAASRSALKRSEARRDAVLAVSLAIARRGQNPLTDWTVKDTDTAYAIGDMLVGLS